MNLHNAVCRVISIYSHVYLILWSGIPLEYSNQIFLYVYFFFPCICSSSLLDLITILWEGYKVSCSLCYFLCSSVISFFIGENIILSVLFSKTTNLYTSHAHKKKPSFTSCETIGWAGIAVSKVTHYWLNNFDYRDKEISCCLLVQD